MTLLRNETPLETHECNGVPVLVKREDLCCPPPGPSFSKMRGVVAHMEKRPEKVIGVLDTSHSKAGWAVAWAGSHLGKTVIDFWPRYKDDPLDVPLPREQQRRARDEFGAITVALKAGRSAILYHRARRFLREHYQDAYLMPNALKLSESVEETAEEVRRTNLPDEGIMVVSISSGTIAAGVLKGLASLDKKYLVTLHMGYSRSKDAVMSYLQKMSGVDDLSHVTLIDEDYEYKDEVRIRTPFPCNPFYDAKAWNWLLTAALDMPRKPIVFWNIGD